MSRLPQFVYEDPAKAEAATRAQAPRALQEATVEQLNAIIRALSGEMKNRRRENVPLSLDLRDEIAMRSYIILDERGEPVYAEAYRDRVQRRVTELLHRNATMQALERGEPVTDLQLLDLERVLQQELGAPDLQLSPENIHRAYAVRVGSLIEFLRQLLDLGEAPDYAQIVERRFRAYIAVHRFSADQTLFLRTMAKVLAQQRRIGWPDLYEQPFTSLGADAVDRLFRDDEIQDAMAFARGLSIGD